MSKTFDPKLWASDEQQKGTGRSSQFEEPSPGQVVGQEVSLGGQSFVLHILGICQELLGRFPRSTIYPYKDLLISLLTGEEFELWT